MGNILILLALLFAPEPPTSHAFPVASWEAPTIVRLTWWQVERGDACAFLRHEGVDTALGCVAGVAGENTRQIDGVFQAGDILWIDGYSSALPLPAPRFLFFPAVR